ncbi:type II secretion system protein [Pseudidiomarina sediminum]|uniref:type II secretion system protein n=1 Tax=Pseudidiomarina sediminum TaxID=431675 RepID=UPI001C937FE9|nr:type II secretion system protein [Pseudidiomarina sediminum]MBY6063750.1 type II secretion system GspH family protein [Pseudidiomarina sediminum]
MQARVSGFTLIEILVAMTILFATVVTGVLAFQNNMQNSVKAAEVMHVLSQVEAARSSIRFTLQHGEETSGTDLYTQDVKIDWAAEQVAYLPPAPYFDEGMGAANTFAPRYQLYAITLRMTYGSTVREFHYEELVWDEQMRQAAASP